MESVIPPGPYRLGRHVLGDPGSIPGLATFPLQFRTGANVNHETRCAQNQYQETYGCLHVCACTIQYNGLMLLIPGFKWSHACFPQYAIVAR